MHKNPLSHLNKMTKFVFGSVGFSNKIIFELERKDSFEKELYDLFQSVSYVQNDFICGDSDFRKDGYDFLSIKSLFISKVKDSNSLCFGGLSLQEELIRGPNDAYLSNREEVEEYKWHVKEYITASKLLG